MSELAKLQEAVMAASNARTDIIRQREKFLADALKISEDATANRFGTAINAAGVAFYEAQKALHSEQDRIAKTGEGALLPVGQRYLHWDRPRHMYGRGPLLKTGAVGIVEIVTSDSERPITERYSRFDLGQTILRLLKKDGSPSKRYERVGKHWQTGNVEPPYGWYAEGTDPNQEPPK